MDKNPDDRPTIDRLVQAVAEALLSVDLTAIPDGATVESEARELAEVAVAALVPLIRAQVAEEIETATDHPQNAHLPSEWHDGMIAAADIAAEGDRP